MRKSNSQQAWIDTGYYQFAIEGLEGIKVERLARILNLNKSGYYHYFGNPNNFLEKVLSYHSVVADSLAFELSAIKQFDPEFISALLTYKTTAMVHMQLARNRHLPLLKACYIKTNKVIDQAVAPSWAEFIGTPDNPEFALRYFEMFRDAFYSRLHLETFNFEFIHSIVYEAKEIIEVAAINKNFSLPLGVIVSDNSNQLINERV